MTLFYTKWNTPLFEWTTPILKLTCLRKNKHDAHPVMFRTFIPNASRSSACISSTYSFPLSRNTCLWYTTQPTALLKLWLRRDCWNSSYAFISSGVVGPVVGRLNGTNSMRLVTLEKMVWTDIQWAKFTYLYTLHLHTLHLHITTLSFALEHVIVHTSYNYLSS